MDDKKRESYLMIKYSYFLKCINSINHNVAAMDNLVKVCSEEDPTNILLSTMKMQADNFYNISALLYESVINDPKKIKELMTHMELTTIEESTKEDNLETDKNLH